MRGIKRDSGQAMILTVLTLGGAILGATTIAGLLMTYQIRQTTDAESSAKAIFAADAGVECSLYNFFQKPPTSCPGKFTLTNGASYSSTVDLVSNTIFSQGYSGTARRAFLFFLASATATIP